MWTGQRFDGYSFATQLELDVVLPVLPIVGASRLFGRYEPSSGLIEGGWATRLARF